jgi:hypothetical protein
LDTLRRGPVGPPTVEQIAGIRIRPSEAGLPVTVTAPTVPGSSKPIATWVRDDFVDFLVRWFELDQQPARINGKALIAEIEYLCDVLGMRQFKHQARDIAQEIRPVSHRKAGRSDAAIRAATEGWCEHMREKRELLLQDQSI